MVKRCSRRRSLRNHRRTRRGGGGRSCAWMCGGGRWLPGEWRGGGRKKMMRTRRRTRRGGRWAPGAGGAVKVGGMWRRALNGNVYRGYC